MARTRLRGIKLAGISLAVESPPGLNWDWPAGSLRELSCATVDPEVYVGVSVGSISAPGWDPITYSFDGGTFDIGQVGEEWWIAVHGPTQRFERLARFNSHFSEGEVVISPAAVESVAHPIEGPLLDLLLTHRIIDQGGLVVSGTAVVERGRAYALLCANGCGEGLRAHARQACDGSVQELVTTPGDRFAVRLVDGQPWAFGLPGIEAKMSFNVSSPLESIHIITPSDEVFTEKISCESAMGELVQHVYAPVHAPEQAEKLMDVISDLVHQTTVLRLGQPELQRVVPFVWGRARAALAFALPLPG